PQTFARLAEVASHDVFEGLERDRRFRVETVLVVQRDQARLHVPAVLARLAVRCLDVPLGYVIGTTHSPVSLRVFVPDLRLATSAGLRRELREELGPSLEVEVERPILTWIRLPEPPRRTDFVFLVAFLCRHRRGEIVLSSEHVEFRWMTRSECDSVHLAPGYAAPLEQFWRTTSVSSP